MQQVFKQIQQQLIQQQEQCEFFYLILKVKFFYLNKIKLNRFPKGLIHYWSFNGNLNDVVGGKHLTNGANCKLSNDRFGRPNSAISLNNGYYKVPTGTYLSGDFTLSLWFNVRSMETMPTMFEVSNYQLGGDNDRVSFFLFDSKIRFTISEATKNRLACIALIFRVELNKWIHATFVYAKNSRKIYINGVEQVITCVIDTREGPTNVIRSTNFIGRNVNTLRFNYSWPDFKGDLDEIRIYNYALADAQIKADFNNIGLLTSNINESTAKPVASSIRTNPTTANPITRAV